MRRSVVIKGLSSGVTLFAAGAYHIPEAFAADSAMRIGSVLAPEVSTPFLVAQDVGIFKAHNVSATVKLFSSGAVLTQAITGKSLDLGAAGGVPATFLAGHQVPVRAIARICELSWSYALMAMPKSNIQKPSDLDGKTVGATFGTVSQYLVLAYAKHWNIPVNSIKLVNLNPSDQVNALVTGKIAAASLWSPFTAHARDAGAVVITTALRSNLNGYPSDTKLVGDPGVLFGNADFLAQNADATVRLLQAIYEAEQWTSAHKDKAAAIVAKYLNVTTESMVDDLNHAEFTMRFDAEFGDELKEEWDFLKEAGFIQSPFPKQGWLDPSLMRRAVAGMVSVG